MKLYLSCYGHGDGDHAHSHYHTGCNVLITYISSCGQF